MKSKHLFLDFDGVLHPNDVVKGQVFCHVPVLADALAGSDVQIVVTSSWRLYEAWGYIENLFPDTIRGMLKGHTGASQAGRWARWNEICAYVGRNEILDWMALDDAETEFPPNCQNLILCDGRSGLQIDQIASLRRWIEEV